MRIIGRFQGKYGRIDIVEKKADGTRLYVEEGFLQSQATCQGDTPFQYIRLMLGILHQANNVLLLGCGGGTLATQLIRAGKSVHIVDRNPLSFQIAQRYFGMPENIPHTTADFISFLRETSDTYDAIAIDVSGPGFAINRTFDNVSCDLIRSRLATAGRIAMNTTAESDIDPWPDRIAARLAGNSHTSWLFDHPGEGEHNVIIACRPETTFRSANRLAHDVMNGERPWTCRKARLRFRDLAYPAPSVQSLDISKVSSQ